MYLIYSTNVLSFFSVIPEQIDAFVLFWHDFYNPDVVEIGLLH
jgi:hypothetical protein